MACSSMECMGLPPANRIPPNLPVVSLFMSSGFTGSPAEQERAARQTGVVAADGYPGMRAATEHLLALGHHRIAFLNNSICDKVLYPPRLAGYLDALREAGITPDIRWIRPLSIPSPKLYFMQAGRETMSRWLREDWHELGCTALLAHNDETAWGVIEALRVAGIDVPGQVSVIGFDGTEVAEYCTPPLTTVEVPLHQIGRVSVEMLLRRMQGDTSEAETIVLPTRLRIRSSTAPLAV